MCQWHAELNKPLLHGLEEKQNVAKTRKCTSKVIDHPGFPALSETQYFKDSYNKEIPSEEEHCFYEFKSCCVCWIDYWHWRMCKNSRHVILKQSIHLGWKKEIEAVVHPLCM